jgi:hypothetical protein
MVSKTWTRVIRNSASPAPINVALDVCHRRNQLGSNKKLLADVSAAAPDRQIRENSTVRFEKS